MPAPAPGRTPSLRERFDAMRNLPPFLRQIWQTSRALTATSLGLRLVRALLPVATLYVGKLIIDEAVRLVGAGVAQAGLADAWRAGELSHLLALLLLEFALAIAADLLGRLVAYADGLLSELFTNAASVRLMEHAATLDLEDFEDPDLQDKLDRARRQTMGRMNLMGQLFGQAQDAITVVSFATGLLVYAPWLIVLLAIALVPAFVGEAHFNAMNYTLNFQWTPERRQLEYLRQTGASVETAKEVKIFNLHGFLVARFRALADGFYAANRRLARSRALWGTLFAALGTLGYYVAYAYIVWRTVHGDFSIGDLTFLAGSFRRLRQLLEGLLVGFSQVAGQALYLDDLFSFFEIEPEIVSKPDALPVPRPIARGFAFERVGFRYPDAARWALRDVSFALHAGEV
ncbi:MAG TPA: ABC transporter ATP-binding protein, partial [Xanthomonadaceae bacterium]|nr:ABC transporter ATP-binding protein [Xanthomonadaceae bacterium]